MESESQRKPAILLLGAFPPQAQGIPGYCGALAAALAAHGPVRAIGFKAMYPAFLFPGVKTAMDPTSRAPQAPNLSVDHSLAWYNPFGWIRHAFATPAELIHIQWWSLPLFPVCLVFALAARIRRIPLVITVHNVLPHEPGPWFLLASRVLCRLADHLIVHSETNRAQLLQHFHSTWEKVSCIAMGAGAPQAEPSTRAEARAQLDIDPNRHVLLFFGTIRPYKGLDVLLRALAAVRGRHPDVLLIVAGKPWERWDRYAALIEAEALGGNLQTRLDYIPEAEVPRYFAAADLVVLPYTHFDAQSAVGAQALGHGRPMVVTDTGGLPALVRHDARWIAPPNDPEALAGKIITFFGDAADASTTFAELARHAEKTMSWESSASEHWAIYSRLVG